MTYRKSKRTYKRKRQNGKFEKRVKNIVNRTIAKKIEYKHHDINVKALALSTTATIASLASISQGLSSGNRIGAEINPTSLIIKYNLLSNVLVQYHRIRCVVFQWFSDQSADPPSATRLLLGYGGTAPYTCEQYDARDHAMYKVLYDKSHYLESTLTNVAGVHNQSLTGNYYIKLKNLKKIMYRAGSNLAADGQLYFMMFSDSILNDPTINYTVKLTYSDL